MGVAIHLKNKKMDCFVRLRLSRNDGPGEMAGDKCLLKNTLITTPVDGILTAY